MGGHRLCQYMGDPRFQKLDVLFTACQNILCALDILHPNLSSTFSTAVSKSSSTVGLTFNPTIPHCFHPLSHMNTSGEHVFAFPCWFCDDAHTRSHSNMPFERSD